MAYKGNDSRIGAQALTTTSDVQNHPVLTRTRGSDPTVGDGEFVYLKGVASTAAGDAVTFDEAGATTRVTSASRGPVAIAMSANVANQWGWYQVRGIATVAAVAGVTADALVSLSATTGALDKLTTAQYLVTGARWQSDKDTPATGFAYCALDGPFAAGITGIG